MLEASVLKKAALRAEEAFQCSGLQNSEIVGCVIPLRGFDEHPSEIGEFETSSKAPALRASICQTLTSRASAFKGPI